MRRMLAFASCLILLLAVPAVAQPRGEAVPLLVTSEWLAAHLDDPQVVVLWTDQGSHDEALIPGARAVPHESLMTMQGGHQLAATDDLVRALRKAGVSNESHVVIYGDALSAGWLFFVLDHLGHTRMSLLDGGLAKWRSEDRPIARTPVAPPRGDVHRAAARAAAGQRRRRAGAGEGRRQCSSTREARRSTRRAGFPARSSSPGPTSSPIPAARCSRAGEELIELFRAAGAASGIVRGHVLPDRPALERALLRRPLRRARRAPTTSGRGAIGRRAACRSRAADGGGDGWGRRRPRCARSSSCTRRCGRCSWASSSPFPCSRGRTASRGSPYSRRVMLVEVAVLAFNGMRCPLTDLAARYTDDRRDNFDIYLPLWLAAIQQAHLRQRVRGGPRRGGGPLVWPVA